MLISVQELLNASYDNNASILRVSARSDDAGLMRVSALGVSVTTSPLSADSSSISAKQQDAGNLRISARSDDAGLMRVSAVGGTAGDRTLVDGTTQTISATLTPISANPATTVQGLVTHANQPDASRHRVSGIIDSGSVSAKQGDATNLRVSAIIDNGSVSARSADANQFHVSSVQGDAGLQRTSAITDSAGQLRISAFNQTATNFLVSSVQADAGLQRTSSIQADAGSQRTSAIQTDANNQHVSASQGDAGLLRISADMFADTVGSLTVYRTLNASASQAVKATAGALYGYYIGNSDTKFNYLKFYNTSGAINVGTDTPILTVPIPPSAGANVEYAHGIKGFTNGIGIAALSSVADNATTAAAASAVVANIFYS